MNTTKLNVRRLISDVGGAAKTAAIVGVPRTAPYGWMNRGFVRTTVLEQIKAARPELNIDDYFEVSTHAKDKTGCSAGVH